MSKYVESYINFANTWPKYWINAQSEIISKARDYVPDGFSVVAPDAPPIPSGRPFVEFVSDSDVIVAKMEPTGLMFSVHVEGREIRTPDPAVAFCLIGHMVSPEADKIARQILDAYDYEDLLNRQEALEKSNRIRAFLQQQVPGEIFDYLFAWGLAGDTVYAHFKDENAEMQAHFGIRGGFVRATVIRIRDMEYAEYFAPDAEIAFGNFLFWAA